MSLKGLLYCFASVLKTNQNLENLTEKDIINIVITKIHDLVPEQDSGRTYLFHIKGYDSLLKDKNFWKWFVEHFWGCLIQKLPDITKKHPCLKLIFLFESEIDVEVEPNYIYSFPEAFTQTKIVNLPLEPCDMGEIRTWLYKFSCLPQSIIDQILDILQQVTDRKPHQVYDLFRDKLIQHLQNV